MRNLAKHAVRLIVTLLLGGFLGASLVRFAPGYGADEEDLDSRLSGESAAALRLERARAESLPRFYLHYLARLVHGDFGISRGLREPARKLLEERFPETLHSVVLGLALGWTLGLLFAICGLLLSARLLDAGVGLLSAIVISMPAAVLALLFVMVRAPGRLAIGLIVFPKVYGYARNLLRDCAALPHVLTARAKGLRPLRILLWHILPAAAPPLFALAGVTVCMAFAAAIPVEVVCDLPGIGQLAWKAALSRDLELLVNLTMVATTITLAANSVAELLAARTRAEGA